eukprot:TRINITY_DN3043_c0_g1_i13.p1 TRINITY_DN3043_c0_g1~~TRINITY_DN3043_c0_g1_i13.p1  ORF type:complete len:193 (+),score=46.45 TRINITY_DN3043_c0_g1_i13:111-689(+)
MTEEVPIQSFDSTAKKKKKPTNKKKPATESESASKDPFKAGGVDYEYKFLLDRINGLLLNKTKDLNVRKKVLIKPPDVQRLTGRRSAWINFEDTCKTLDRKQEHLLQYISTELNMDSSLNSEKQLIMRGRVTNKQIESVLKKYISTLPHNRRRLRNLRQLQTCEHHTLQKPEDQDVRNEVFGLPLGSFRGRN